MNMALAPGLAEQLTTSPKIPNEKLTQLLLRQKVGKPAHSAETAEYCALYNYPETRKLDWLCKRCLDVMGSLFGLVILSPLFLLISLAICLDSKGPVLFAQERVGLKGKPFKMYKFRSMYVDAEERLMELLDKNESSVMFKIKNDPRITRVGRILRKYSLDEFPQLLNVLKGEMSLVGPRPALPRELASYEQWHFARLSTLPGMTGLWQVLGRSNISNFDDVVCMDIHYLENWSFVTDLMLIAKTFPAVIKAKGAS